MQSKTLVSCLLLCVLLSACAGEASPTLSPPSSTPIPSDPTATSQPTATQPSLPLHNVKFVTDGNALQTLDIILPDVTDRAVPTILAVHGGGGNKSEFWAWARHFAELGYATVTINYRGMPEQNMSPPKSPYPASVEDTFCAMSWIYANADDYHFDTQRLAAMGFSLGGTLTAMLGTVDDRAPYLQDCPSWPDEAKLKGVVTFSAEFDYTLPMLPDLVEYFTVYLGADPQTDPQRWADASPITWVDGSEPPFLLLQGSSDEWIAVDQPNTFIAALQNANVDVDIKFLPGDHMAIIENKDAFTTVDAFLKKLFEQR